MIAYIKGEITFKTPEYILVETGGIGYQVFISLSTYAQIEKLERVKIWTYQHIKEDSHTLYGFADQVEKKLFGQLISVSGVGPSTAIQILSSMELDELKGAIIGENTAAFKRVKGVGTKTAQRIILDLKDKLLKDGAESIIPISATNNTIKQEALSALVGLGFQRSRAQKALNAILKSQPEISSVEELVKQSLKQLS